ncbi:sugar transporter [Nesidiocoris tenuis]|uniref:Sugar transporter n=1 Tax=Nesidiocoris tenuis TaxID=355587 RepID=A0ABN7B055_9HEMI|nr:sugar transporter [Nesidiocoris tenuis]
MRTAHVSDAAVEEVPRVRRESPWFIEFILFFVVALLCVSAGFVTAWSPPEFKHEDEDDEPFFVLQPDPFGFLVLAPYVIGSGASLVFGYISHRCGRKAALYVAALFGSVSGFTFLFAEGPAPVYVGRVASCICMAGATVICPVFVIETVRDSSRGIYVSRCVLLIFLGVLLGGGMGQLLKYTPYCTFLIILPTLFVFLFFWLPETPYYYLSKSKPKHAELSLVWMRGRDYTDQDLKYTLNQFQQREPGIWRGICLYLIRGVGSVYITLHYLAKGTLAISTNATPNETAIIMTSLLLLSSFLGTLATDRAGRKLLLYLSYGGCACCFLITALYDFLKIEKFLCIPLIGIGMSTVFNGIGYGTLTPLVAMEMTAPSKRCFISCIGSSLEYLVSFTLVFAYPLIGKFLCSSANFMIPVVANTIGLYFTWLAVTETDVSQPNGELPSISSRFDPAR